MPTLQKTGLSYSQTLMRMVAYMGQQVEVRGFDRTGGSSFLAARGILRGGVSFMDYGAREPEMIAFVVSEYGGFMLCEADFVEGETVGDCVLRIEQRRFILTVSLAG
jgi:hypothetical protein